jgi:dGTPase
MNDIIQISVKNVYQSREVIQKEVMGYKIINNLLDGFCTAYNKKENDTASNYDELLLKLLPERFQFQKKNLYDRLLHICHFVSLLTDGKALELYKTIQANKS